MKSEKHIFHHCLFAAFPHKTVIQGSWNLLHLISNDKIFTPDTLSKMWKAKFRIQEGKLCI